MLDVRSLWDWCRDVLGRGRHSPRVLWADRLRADSGDG